MTKVASSAFEGIITSINEKMGRNSISSGLGSLEITNYLKTGSWIVDLICGGVNTPGIAMPRIVMSWGPSHSGKTLLLVSTMGNLHNAGGATILIDSEDSFSKKLALKSNFNPERNLTIKSRYLEEGFDLLVSTIPLVREELTANKVSGKLPILCGWDGFSWNLTQRQFEMSSVEDSEKEEEGEDEGLEKSTKGKKKVGKKKPAEFATAMREGFRKLFPVLSDYNAGLWLITQPTTHFALAGKSIAYQVPFGGNAIKIVSSFIFSHKMGMDIVSEGNTVGNVCRLEIEKNKDEGRRSELDLVVRFDTGLNDTLTILYFMIKRKLCITVGKSGWKTMTLPKAGEFKFQNDSDFMKVVTPEILDELKTIIVERCFS